MSGRPIRVLRVITRLNAGGPSRHVVWLASGLASRGYETRLAAGTLSPGEDDLSGFAVDKGIEVRRVPSLQRDLRPLLDWRSLREVMRLLREFEPHLVHSHHSKAGFAARFGTLLVNRERKRRGSPPIRTVHTFHGNPIHVQFSPVRASVLAAAERFLSHRATDAVVVLSAEQREEIVGRFRLAPAGRVFLVPNAIDLSAFEELPPAGAFRREIGFSPADFVVGAVGRVSAQKNYAMLLQAAAIVAKASARARFVIIGGGEGLEELRRLAGELRIADRVAFPGARTDLPAIYAGLDVLALSSRHEGTPLALIEAMAAGRPIVATDVGGVRDLLTREPRGDVFAREFVPSENPRGLLVADGDVENLAASLLRLEREPDAARRFGEAGRRYAVRHHSLPRLFDDLDRLYRRILGLSLS
jgi:glycosyltransferase involved in cell wall biosynthesis